MAPWMERYGVDSSRYGPPSGPHDERDHRHAGHHPEPDGTTAESVDQPVKVDNALYIRDYASCILCYKCVQACGEEAQNTFAIAVAGRGFDARISTELDTPLTDSAVLLRQLRRRVPDGCAAVPFPNIRAAGIWRGTSRPVTRRTVARIAPSADLELHVQDNRIVKVTSPLDHSVTHGNLCIKGRFGYDYVQELGDLATSPIDEVLRAAC